MRIRTVLGVLTLAALSPGCALPCVAVHNIRVEMRDNLDEHMAAVRAWWQRGRAGRPACPPAPVQDLGPALPSAEKGRGIADRPLLLPPPSPARGEEKTQAASPYNSWEGTGRP